MAKTILTDSDISEIIKLYQSDIPSTHKLAKKFSVGHKRISSILKENNVEINKKGGQLKYGKEISYKKKLDKQRKDGMTIVAVCKKTGKEYNDYTNKSGALTNHLKNIYPNIDIPSSFKRIMYYNTNDKYWHEQYFDLVDRDTAPIKKCKYCEWDTTDVDNNTGCYENHLNKYHNKSLKNYLKEFPKEIDYFPKYEKKLKRQEYLSKLDNRVICKICGEKFKQINEVHCKNKHGISLKEYKELYGVDSVISKTTHKTLTELMAENQKLVKPSFVSKPEKELHNFLNKHNIKYEKGNRNILSGGKEIDIFIPDLGLGIEYNGLVWHSEKFGNKPFDYHLDKTEQMNKAGYQLIHIFEDEWLNKKDIVISKLKYTLGLFNGFKIRASKCFIQEINKEIKNDFLNRFHIQGSDLSQIKYGAYWNNTLVGVMTFIKSRGLNKKTGEDYSVYELSRFCTNYNFSVMGLGDKMLKQFISDYNPNKIISFADRRWTKNKDSNLYTKLGFDLVEINKPTYFYFNGDLVRHHKFNYIKSKLLDRHPEFDSTMTEWEIMQELGYDRIWDCGLFKYELTP